MVPNSILAPSGLWEYKFFTVIGTGGLDRLLFRESRAVGASDGSGPYMDDVVLRKDPSTASIHGRLFIDTDGDNTEKNVSSGLEPPLAGKTIFLLDINGYVVMTTTADDDGRYCFSDIPAGSYRVDFSPGTLTPVLPGIGDSSFDSEIDPATGLSKTPIIISIAQRVDEYDGGYRAPTTPSPTPSPTAVPTPSPTIETTVPRGSYCPTCGTANNLVCNGSFEQNFVSQGSSVFFAQSNVPAWNSLYGAPLKLSNGVNGVFAFDGVNFLELDGSNVGAAEGVYQFIPTEKDQEYLLSFHMRASSKAQANQEDETIVVSILYISLPAVHTSPSEKTNNIATFQVEWDGVKCSQTGYKALSGDWECFQYIVKGTGDCVKLLFRESTSLGASDGTGPFLDQITLVPLSSGFEPIILPPP